MDTIASIEEQRKAREAEREESEALVLKYLHRAAERAKAMAEIAEEHGTTLQDLVAVMNNDSLDVIAHTISHRL